MIEALNLSIFPYSFKQDMSSIRVVVREAERVAETEVDVALGREVKNGIDPEVLDTL